MTSNLSFYNRGFSTVDVDLNTFILAVVLVGNMMTSNLSFSKSFIKCSCTVGKTVSCDRVFLLKASMTTLVLPGW